MEYVPVLAPQFPLQLKFENSFDILANLDDDNNFIEPDVAQKLPVEDSLAVPGASEPLIPNNPPPLLAEPDVTSPLLVQEIGEPDVPSRENLTPAEDPLAMTGAAEPVADNPLLDTYIPGETHQIIMVPRYKQ